MKSVEESADRIERHVAAFWKTLIALTLTGASAIGGVYLYSTARADTALAKAAEVERGAATVVYHDEDTNEQLATARKTHDDIEREKDRARAAESKAIVDTLERLADEQRQLTREMRRARRGR